MKNKKIKVDSFEFAEYHAKRAFPKSKTPFCDFVGNYPSDMCSDSPVILLDYAKQLEYNWRYYEAKYRKEAPKNKKLRKV